MPALHSAVAALEGRTQVIDGNPKPRERPDAAQCAVPNLISCECCEFRDFVTVLVGVDSRVGSAVRQICDKSSLLLLLF